MIIENVNVETLKKQAEVENVSSFTQFLIWIKDMIVRGINVIKNDKR